MRLVSPSPNRPVAPWKVPRDNCSGRKLRGLNGRNKAAQSLPNNMRLIKSISFVDLSSDLISIYLTPNRSKSQSLHANIVLAPPDQVLTKLATVA